MGAVEGMAGIDNAMLIALATDGGDGPTDAAGAVVTGGVVFLDEVVDVLLCLAEVAGRKTLSFRERKMFDHARQLLAYEVAEVLDKPVEKVEREVEKALEFVPEPDDD